MPYITIIDDTTQEIVHDISDDDEDICADALGGCLLVLAHRSDEDETSFTVKIEF